MQEATADQSLVTELTRSLVTELTKRFLNPYKPLAKPKNTPPHILKQHIVLNVAQLKD